MKKEDFNCIVKEQLDICANTLIIKGKEYNTTTDRLDSFKKAAEIQGITQVEAIAGMMSKHTISIYDMCRVDCQNFDMEKWIEKITDHINYLLILKAAVVEEREKLVCNKLK